MKNTPKAILEIPENIRHDTLNYRQRVDKLLREETSPSQFKAYRVPMGIYEQRDTGKYMVRIRIPAGIALPHQLECIAELSKMYGSGVTHVTTRQDLQIHDVAVEHTPEILEKLLEVGLSPRGGGGNTVRNVTVCPRSGVCPEEAFDVAPFAIGLSEYLLQNNSAFNLPRKFKVAFSGCSKDCAFASVADVGFFAHMRDGEEGFSVYAGGGLGSSSRTAVIVEDFIPARRIFQVTEAVKRLFDIHGDRTNKHRARLRYVLMRFKQKEFVKIYKAELGSVKREGLSDSVPAIREIIRNHKPGKDIRIQEDLEASVAEHVENDKTPGLYSILLNLKGGNIMADDLVRVGRLAKRYGEGFVRTTQLQDLLICSVGGLNIQKVFRTLKELSINVIDYGGVSVVSCAGASTCKLGLCNSRGLAEELERVIASLKIPSRHQGVAVKISGCPNCCGHHHIGDIGFEGKAKRVQSKLMPFYDVIFGAHIAEGEARLGKCLGSLPAKQVPAFLKEIIFSPQVISSNAIKDTISRYRSIPLAKLPADFYNDFGMSEPFTLAGRGPGECGAGVMDLIRTDIDTANELLKTAGKIKKEEEKNNALYSALLSSARALLVIFGLEPNKDEEVFNAFSLHLIRPGWIEQIAQQLIDDALSWRKGERKSIVDLAESINTNAERVEKLFYSLDSNFKFQLEPVGGKIEKSAAASLGSHLLDLRGVACPMNFVRAKLELEKMKIGDILDILLDDGEPVRNVPASFREEGQDVKAIKKENEHFCVTVRKNE
jgi:sulfite reductase (ferredoxin)